MEQQSSNKLLLPVAIIIAGALIAFAIYATQKPSNTQNLEELNAEAEDIDIKPVSTEDHILGNPNALAIFVEYSDTECPFCKRYHETMKKIVDTYGKDGTVAWAYRHFPIVGLHTKAPKESEAMECAAELGGPNAFWAYTNRIYEVTPANDGLDPLELPKIASFVGLDTKAFNSCLESGKYTQKIKTAVEDAVKAGARGTPYTVILLKNKAPDTIKPFIESASLQLKLPPGTLGVTPDNKKIIVSGNMPFELLEQLINLIKN